MELFFERIIRYLAPYAIERNWPVNEIVSDLRWAIDRKMIKIPLVKIHDTIHSTANDIYYRSSSTYNSL